jgi:amino acid transporter
MIVEDDAELPSEPGDSGKAALIENALSLWQVLFFGVATLGGVAILALNAGAILHITGYGSWLAVLLGTLLALFVAAPIVIFARRHTVTGSLMSLLGEEFGARWRPIPGAALLGGYIVALMNASTCVVLYGGSFLNDLGWTVASNRGVQITIVIFTIALAVWLTIAGITESMKVTISLIIASLPFVLIVCVASVVRGGVDFEPQLRLEGLTPGTLTAGVVFAVGNFVGFEALTALGKETKNARHGIPIVLVTVILIIGAVTVAGAFTQIPLLMRHIDQLDAGVSPNAVLAQIGGVEWTNIPTDALLAAVCLAGAIGFTNSAARVFATMGRDGGLPRWLGTIHPSRHTPVNAAYLIGGVVLVLTAGHLLVMKEGVLEAIATQVDLMSNLWLVAYLAACVGGVVYGLRRSTRSAWAVGLSVIGGVGILWAWGWRLLNPDDSFSFAAPWITLAWTVVVAFAIAYGERRRRGSEASERVGVITRPPTSRRVP